jgi:signal transduction histidine kinase
MKPIPKRSLQIKLLISFSLIILLTTGLGYAFVASAINNSFEDFLDESTQSRFYQYLEYFSGEPQQNIELETFDFKITHQAGPHGVVEGFMTDDIESHIAIIQSLNLPIAITNINGEIIAGPDADLQGQHIPQIKIVGRELAQLSSQDESRFAVPLTSETWRSPLEDRFVNSIPTALLPVALIVGGVALLLSFGIVGQTIGPLRRLDDATRKVADGNFEERVDVKGNDEVSHLALSFNEMAESLQQAETSKRNMIADVYHELRTPISIVQTGLEGLIDGVIDPSQENFSALHDRTQLIGRLVNDLQQLALADAGQLSIEKHPCDLSELFSHIETAIETEMAERNITLELDFDLKESLINADVQRIEQVILNLLSNAERHTPDGGHVRLSALNTENDSIEISVCDTGPGIPAEDLENIFERFYRADKSRARSSGGSGLGLTIAKVLVEAHGGRIWAENSPEGGACLRFVLGQG